MAAINPVSRTIDFPRLFKEAVLAAVVAFALALPMVGFQTVDVTGGLDVVTRFDWVAYGVAFVFVGRLLIGFYRGIKTPVAQGDG